ncbi:MAG: hypothetical protein AVDCRST_MAG20-707, partial [uncultured Acidimicrobiales bacterium]
VGPLHRNRPPAAPPGPRPRGVPRPGGPPLGGAVQLRQRAVHRRVPPAGHGQARAAPAPRPPVPSQPRARRPRRRARELPPRVGPRPARRAGPLRPGLPGV